MRRIRELLYEQGFTISGARNRLGDPMSGGVRGRSAPAPMAEASDPSPDGIVRQPGAGLDLTVVRHELRAALALLERAR